MSAPDPDAALSYLAGLLSAEFALPGRKDSTSAGQLADEMAACWRRGERLLAEEFLNRRPELWDRPDEAIRVVYEEICLRQEFGDPDPTAGLVERFTQWQTQLALLLDCHRLVRSVPGRASQPTVGECVGEFRILAELGRGAVGGVYLAAQPALSDRPVVLKVTPRAGHEHLSLARLQHTHIVPLYSSFDDTDRDLRVLCMPYYGGASLARLIEFLCEIPPGQRTGRDLLAALDHAQAASPVHLPARGPAREFIAQSTIDRVACWIGISLAEGLHYAHERGLVHLDLKPANVLLAFDGTPMLLDFHLARSPLTAGTPSADRIGGTPLYMAPEQARVLDAQVRGEPAPVSVDGRADVYALGLLLFEFLGGAMPVDASRRSSLPRVNPQASVGLADVLHKCLARDPDHRYQSAVAFATDLRRHLNDQLLHGVSNRSLTERWRKWRRRKPNAILVAAAVLAVAAAGIVGGSHVRKRYAEPEAALNEGRRLRSIGNLEQAIEMLERGQQQVESLPMTRRIGRNIGDEIAIIKRDLAARDLHKLADQIRFTAIVEPVPHSYAHDLESACRRIWEGRDRLPTDERSRTDLLDVAVIGAGLRVQLASTDQKPEAYRAALRTLDEAEALFGSSCVLQLERDRHRRALNPDEPPASPTQPPRTTWELVQVGRSMLRVGQPGPAREYFTRAIHGEPSNFWAHFYQGHACRRLGRSAEAVAAFTICIALAPESGAGYFNRGLLFCEERNYSEARRDLDAAVSRGVDAELVRPLLAILDREKNQK